MIGYNVAKRYAKALEELGLESSSLDRMVDQLGQVADAYKTNEELRQALANPLVALESKRGVIREIAGKLGLDTVSTHALLLLADRRRLSLLPAVAQLLREFRDARKGLLRAEVRTAVRLTPAQSDKLQARLEAVTGRKVVLDQYEDATLLAGVTLRVGDRVFDGSLRTHLQDAKGALLSSAS